MTEAEREEFRQFNGNTINELCELGEKVLAAYADDIRRITAETEEIKRRDPLEIVNGLPRQMWAANDTRDYWE